MPAQFPPRARRLSALPWLSWSDATPPSSLR
jgi:hypothetical protein